MNTQQIRMRIEDVGNSLARKMDDFRRLSGIVEFLVVLMRRTSGVSNENIVLRPTNMTPAESELFDAQFTESPPDPRKTYGSAVASTANQMLLPPPSSIVEAQKSQSGPVTVDGQQQVT